MNTLGLTALVFVVVPVPEAVSQQTPQAQPAWTPSPDCVRLDALRDAHRNPSRSWTPAEDQEFRELVARTGLDGCEREADRHAPIQRARPEWGPLTTPALVIKQVFPMPTPSP